MMLVLVTTLSANMMIKRIQKMGNSLGLSYPSQYLKALGLRHGDEVQIDFDGESIVIKPVLAKRAIPFTLDDLLKGMTPSKAHVDELIQPSLEDWDDAL